MSKWVQFYHKINKFDLVNMRFTDDFSIVEMVGMDSVMPIDGRLNLSSIRDVVQKKIESMKKIEITRAGMGEKCPYPKFSKLLAKGYIMCHRCKYCAEIISETEIMCDYN